MKKYLYGALALPLLFACSSDDLIEKGAVSNDQFPGIEKVDATFSMYEGVGTRFDGAGTGEDANPAWKAQEGDTWGFAWLTNDYTGTTNGTILAIDGQAKQNHNLIQTNGVFKPQTSIYVGKYYLYRPYDETTVDVGKINFNSLAEQTIAEGYQSSTQAWKNLAKTAINIGDKWTEVTPDGWDDLDGTTWDKAGIKQHYNIYAALFSNQTGLDMTYTNNDVAFDGTTTISGATDIEFTPAAGTKVGAADIYNGTVELQNADKSFTYAPTTEPMADAGETEHSGTFWADKSDLQDGGVFSGFSFTSGEIALNARTEDAENGIETEGKTSGWIWFNSLPVRAGNGGIVNTVKTVLTTSYGIVTINETVGSCAYVFDQPHAGAVDGEAKEWIKLNDAADDLDATPKTWNVDPAVHNTFINQYGNHKGKYEIEVDFSKGDLDGMHIINDTHLQKALKYYIAAGKTDAGVTLLLDGDDDNEFKISKISIALLQTINTGTKKVQVRPCTTHGTPKIIITQDGQEALGLADAKEVPELNSVFDKKVDVYLSSACEWTWSGGSDGTKKLKADGFIKSITNEGTLTVNATNVEVSYGPTTLANAAGATMNITQVTTVKNDLSNLGTINVGSASNTSAELRAYGKEIKNDATDATDLTKRGTINNYGVIGSADGIAGSEVNNYGEINVMNAAAITLLRSNELNPTAFDHAFDAANYKMGSVVIPSPFALVSVSNGAENGFIKYIWPAATTTYATPTGGVVKYNTIVVSGDITFTIDEDEIQYIEFNGTRTQVVNPTNPADDTDTGYLDNLKGIIVNAGKSIIIEKNNGINCTVGAFLGAGATIYKGGNFKYPAGATTNYFGTWQTDQIIVW